MSPPGHRLLARALKSPSLFRRWAEGDETLREALVHVDAVPVGIGDGRAARYMIGVFRRAHLRSGVPFGSSPYLVHTVDLKTELRPSNPVGGRKDSEQEETFRVPRAAARVVVQGR